MKKLGLWLGLGVALVAAYIFFLNQSPDGDNAVAGFLVPTLTLDEQTGKVIYDANCASCHGENGSGSETAGPPFVHIIYEPNHHGDRAFQMAVQNGVRSHHWRFGNMPPVQGLIESDVEKIITYVRAVQRANGIGGH